MQPQLDPDIINAGRDRQPASRPPRPALPDIHDVPRRRLPLMILAGAAFIFGTGSAYVAEAILPIEYRLTRFIGDFRERIEEATRRGYNSAQIVYEAQLRGVEVQYQNTLKHLETEAAQWQEHCRVGLQNWNNYYQAAYNRAHMLAQTTAQIQAAYMALRNQTSVTMMQGEIAATNLATMLGLGMEFLQPNSGRQAFQYAERQRADVMRRIDRTARGGVTLSIRGWDTNLPQPGSLPAMIRCDLPAFTSVSSARPITIPHVAPPGR